MDNLLKRFPQYDNEKAYNQLKIQFNLEEELSNDIPVLKKELNNNTLLIWIDYNNPNLKKDTSTFVITLGNPYSDISYEWTNNIKEARKIISKFLRKMKNLL